LELGVGHGVGLRAQDELDRVEDVGRLDVDLADGGQDLLDVLRRVADREDRGHVRVELDVALAADVRIK
jgi:hypothetical protein